MQPRVRWLGATRKPAVTGTWHRATHKLTGFNLSSTPEGQAQAGM